MCELPEGMLTRGRRVVPRFDRHEWLFRRVPDELWDNDSEEPIDLDAIALPDMSVLRSRFAHPEWARFDRGEYRLLAVIGFQVESIPNRLVDAGSFVWTFGVVHSPTARNYPHSEVQACENGLHVDGRERLTAEVHLRWRQQLLHHVRIFLRANQETSVRMESPAAG